MLNKEPYASAYLGDKPTLKQPPYTEMEKYLNTSGLGVAKQFNEPADHLAVQLDFLANQFKPQQQLNSIQNPVIKLACPVCR